MTEAAVTDTHPLLFHAAGSRRLGRRAAEVFDAAERQGAIIYVPAAVIWECGLLAWTGRVDLRRPLPQFFADRQGWDRFVDQVAAAVDRLSPDERLSILRAYIGERTNRRHRPGRAFERTLGVTPSAFRRNAKNAS